MAYSTKVYGQRLVSWIWGSLLQVVCWERKGGRARRRLARGLEDEEEGQGSKEQGPAAPLPPTLTHRSGQGSRIRCRYEDSSAINAGDRQWSAAAAGRTVSPHAAAAAAAMTAWVVLRTYWASAAEYNPLLALADSTACDVIAVAAVHATNNPPQSEAFPQAFFGHGV